MKFASVLLILVGSFVLNCAGDTQSVPLEILEKLRISNTQPEAVPLEEFNYEVDAMADEIPFVPKEVPDQEEIIKTPDELFETNVIQARAGCSVTIKSLSSPQPLYLQPGTSTLWPFNDIGVMEFSAGEDLELFCTTTYSNPSGISGSQTATCVSDSTFAIGGVNYDLAAVLCTSWPSFTARKTGDTCNGGIVVESGFTVGTRFVKQLEICFDEDLEVTRYVYHTLEPGSNYYQSNVARPSFVTAGFFGGKNVDNLYTQVTQTATINTELGGVASLYIDTSTNVYLARGHMAAKADFVYGTEQRGTFLFLNAAPQWQVFNGGNWEKVEDSTRTWVSTNKLNVDCYTGVYGVTTLPNVDGVETPLYLYYDSNHNGLIPVPMLYFRVIIEPSTKRGVVLIGVNNPHLTLEQIEADYILCTDVSDQITWLTWKKTDLKAGYSYACEVAEFAEKNPNLPTFDVTSLLY